MMEHLSPLDAAFLEAEDADPATSMAIASIAIFEGPAPDQDDFVAAYAAKLPLVARYRQVVERLPLDLGTPVWVDDPRFDISRHVRRTTLPSPGADAELNHLMALVMSQRLDRRRPLWETWVVDGLVGGRWALISKVHHCMVDGVSGTDLYHLLLTVTPDPTVPDPAPIASTHAPSRPGPLRLAVEALTQSALVPERATRATLRLASHPRALTRRVHTTARGLAALSSAVFPVTPSTLVGPTGPSRRYVGTVVSLIDVKAIAREHAATVNDVALAAATAGFRALLLSRGEPCDARSVRTLVPVSVRAPGAEGELANRVSAMLVDLPVQLADPESRLHEVIDLLHHAKASSEADAGQTLTELAAAAPYGLLSRLMRAAFRIPQHSVVTVTTNVPGPQMPLYLLGRRMVRMLPFVPIADGVRFGVAMLSYCDELAFGITGDFDTGADLHVISTAAAAEIAALIGEPERRPVLRAAHVQIRRELVSVRRL